MVTSSWIACPKPNPRAKIRLFCFPYSGASASVFFPWIEILPSTVEVYPVQLPGRGNRVSEPVYTYLPDLIDAIEDALLPSFSEKPFALFGHSMGALISYELSWRLESVHQLIPKMLFVSGHNAPHLPDKNEPMHDLDEDEFLERLRKLNGTPEEVLQDRELLELVMPILRADFKLSETYPGEGEKVISSPICACGGLQDVYLDREGLEAWGELTRGGATSRLFPGDHFYLNKNRIYLLQVIAQELNRTIDLNP